MTERESKETRTEKMRGETPSVNGVSAPYLTNEIAKALDEMPTPTFQNSTLSEEASFELFAHLQQSIHEAKTIYFKDKIQTLSVLTHHKTLFKRFQEKIPYLKLLNLTQEKHFLKQLRSKIALFLRNMPTSIEGFNDAVFLKTCHSLLIDLQHYYLTCIPLHNVLTHTSSALSSAEDTFASKIKNLVTREKSEKDIANAFRSMPHHDTKKVKMIETIIHHILTIVYGKNESMQIMRSIENDFYQKEHIEILAHYLLNQAPPHEVCGAIVHCFKNSSKSAQSNFIFLLQTLIKIDQCQFLVDYNGQHSILDTILKKLIEESQNNTIVKLCQDLEKSLKAHKIKQVEKYQRLINKVFKIRNNQDALTQTLRTAIINYHSHRINLKGLTLLLYDMTFYCPDSCFSPNLSKILIQEIGYALRLIEPHFEMFEDLESRVENKINKALFLNEEDRDPPDVTHAFNASEDLFNAQFEKIADGTLLGKERENFINRVLKAVQNQYQNCFQTMDLPPFINKPLSQIVSSSNLYTKIIYYEDMMRVWIVDLILYQIRSPKSQRSDLDAMRRIASFMKDVADRAKEAQQSHAKNLIALSLSHPILQSIGISKEPVDAIIPPIGVLTFDSYPLLNEWIQHLVQFSHDTNGQLKALVLGGFFKQQYDMQNALHTNKIDDDLSLLDYLRNRINDSTLASFANEHGISETEALDTIYDLTLSSFMISHDTLNALSFLDIDESLKKTNKRQLPFIILENSTPLNQANTAKFLIDLLTKRLLDQKRLPSIRLLIDILSQMNKNLYLKDQFSFTLEATRLLNLLYENISLLSKSQSLNLDELTLTVNQIPQVLATFSPEIKNRPDFTILEKSLMRFKNLAPDQSIEFEEPPIQKLLGQYLEGKESKALKLSAKIPKNISNKRKKLYGFEDFEPESDPHSVVGFAKTYNVFESLVANTETGLPFSFNNIKEMLESYFPWVLDDPSTVKKYRVLNLLYLDPNVSPLIQKRVMDLVFTSLDAIGKLAGVQGEYVLYHIDQIDMIVSQLEKTSEKLADSSELQTEEEVSDFLHFLEKKIRLVDDSNQAIYRQLLQPTELITFAVNPQVTELLRHAEERCHKLIQEQADSKFTQEMDFISVLTPVVSQKAKPKTQRFSEKPKRSKEDWELAIDSAKALLNKKDRKKRKPTNTGDGGKTRSRHTPKPG